MSVPLSVEASASSIPEAGGQTLGPGSVRRTALDLGTSRSRSEQGIISTVFTTKSQVRTTWEQL